MSEADHRTQIRHRRIARALGSTLGSLLVAETVFVAFALGASLGPGPLSGQELLVGFAASLSSGVLVSVVWFRARMEQNAAYRCTVSEGRHRRRLVIYRDYLWIAGEVVPFEDILEATLEGESLVLRYRDPRFAGPVLRELSAERTALEKVRALVVPPPPDQAVGSPAPAGAPGG